jgi:hypothetical protein
MDEHPNPAPFCRATVRGGRITLNIWEPGLVSGGPSRALLAEVAEAGAVLADLTIIDEQRARELVVAFVPDGSGTPEAERALLDWAHVVGYRRVWLPTRLVELGATLSPAGEAEVTCPTCGRNWADASPDFWALVRGCGYFPPSCPACNGSLPEWNVVHRPGAGGSESAQSERGPAERP